MAVLEARRAEIDQALAAQPSTPSLRLHPNLSAVYRDKVARVETALNDDRIRAEAAEILRGLIDRIELRPRTADKGLDALLYGDLAAILSLCEDGGTKKRPGTNVPERQLSVVAGACNQLYSLFDAPRIREHPSKETGIVTLTNYGRILVFLREAKPLKTRVVTIGKHPQIRNKFD
jgi:hypothetical protein